MSANSAVAHDAVHTTLLLPSSSTRLQLTADHPPEDEEGFEAVEAGLVERRGSLLRPTGYSDNCTRQVVVSAGRGQGLMAVRVLDELDLGKLIMLVHQVG